MRAELANQGLELAAGADLLPAGDFTWNLSANVSMIRSNVVSWAGASAYILPDSYR